MNQKNEDENLVEEAMNMDEETPKKSRKKRAKEEEKKEEDNLDDSDLFNLIDSFYEKRDEEE